MSHILYRTGRFAARRPWTVIGVWLIVSVAATSDAPSMAPTLASPRSSCQRLSDGPLSLAGVAYSSGG